MRFEMPFAVWCDHCKPHPVIIGQGVRFNAEKTKVGNYYTTPIYSFRMKHTVCAGTIEIRTDPKNTSYVVTEGGHKQDTGEDKPLQPGEIAIKPYGDRQDPAEKDPFSKIEDKMEDKTRAQLESIRILELQKAQSKDWEDPYEKNKMLRRSFRRERKEREKIAAADEAYKERMGLDIELAEKTEDDRQKASMVDFGPDINTLAARAERACLLKPMFERPRKPPHKPEPLVKSRSSHRTKENAVASRKAAWRQELLASSRAAKDPFLSRITAQDRKEKLTPPSKSLFRGKSSRNPSTPTINRSSEPEAARPDDASTEVKTATPGLPLVDYPSDSE